MIIKNEPLKALSWKEPYGSLMLPPHNKIETRTWNTPYRGLVLLCASKKGYTWNVCRDISGEKQFNRILDSYGPDITRRTIEGSAFAIGRLVDCRPMRREDEDRAFVKYFSDLFCHVYENVTPIIPIPWKGSQGFRPVPQDVIEQIQLL